MTVGTKTAHYLSVKDLSAALSKLAQLEKRHAAQPRTTSEADRQAHYLEARRAAHRLACLVKRLSLVPDAAIGAFVSGGSSRHGASGSRGGPGDRGETCVPPLDPVGRSTEVSDGASGLQRCPA